MICPMEARTVKSRPRNFSIVLAFAGDSTITSLFDLEPVPDLEFLYETRTVTNAHLKRQNSTLWQVVTASLKITQRIAHPTSRCPFPSSLHLNSNAFNEVNTPQRKVSSEELLHLLQTCAIIAYTIYSKKGAREVKR